MCVNHELVILMHMLQYLLKGIGYQKNTRRHHNLLFFYMKVLEYLFTMTHGEVNNNLSLLIQTIHLNGTIHTKSQLSLNVSFPYAHTLHNSLWYCSSLPGSIKTLTAATKDWIECSKRSFYHAAWDGPRDWEGERESSEENQCKQRLCSSSVCLIFTSYRPLQPR